MSGRPKYSASVPGLVSAVIPAYNQAEYLRLAIESVIEQTYHPIEIVVVDDGSTDHTSEVCRSFGDRVRYFRQAPSGQGGVARAAAIREARGEWIALLDQDDRWLPRKIEKQLQAFRDCGRVGVVFTATRCIDCDGVALPEIPCHGQPQSGDLFHAFLRANQAAASSAVFRRAVVSEQDLIENAQAKPADYDLWLRICRNHFAVVLPDCLTEYRIHAENDSGDVVKLANDCIILLEQYRRQLHAECPECRRSIRHGLRYWRRKAALVHLRRYFSAIKAGERREALRQLRRAFQLSGCVALRPRTVAAIVKNAIESWIRTEYSDLERN